MLLIILVSTWFLLIACFQYEHLLISFIFKTKHSTYKLIIIFLIESDCFSYKTLNENSSFQLNYIIRNRDFLQRFVIDVFK